MSDADSLRLGGSAGTVEGREARHTRGLHSSRTALHPHTGADEGRGGAAGRVIVSDASARAGRRQGVAAGGRWRRSAVAARAFSRTCLWRGTIKVPPVRAVR